MSWGLDVRLKDVMMVLADVDGGLEPRPLSEARADVVARILARAPAYAPEWTSRRPDDAGVALVGAFGTVTEAVNTRLNRVPRRLLLDQLSLAGVRRLQARPASAGLAIQVRDGATAAVDVLGGTAFLVPGGPVPGALETTFACRAHPGRLASVAVLSDGLVVNDRPAQLDGLSPFGAHPAVGAELWLGIDTPVDPTGLLSLSIEFIPPTDRQVFAAVSTTALRQPPVLRWETVTAAGGREVIVERDETRGLTSSGIVQLRVELPNWTPTTLPGRPADAPLRWVRARLATGAHTADRRLARVTLNGVPADAKRSVRHEVLEPLERQLTGRARYRLSQTPVVPRSVVLDVAESTSAFDDEIAVWTEVDDLAGRGPDERVFMLDATTGIITFGDGTAGRAVPTGFRNVVARVYATGGGTSGLPKAGETLSPQTSIPDLSGAVVLSITSGADAETTSEVARRGPAVIRSRRRAVVPADYSTLALGTEGVEIARAHCLPVRDPRSPGGSVPGLLGVLVVPHTSERESPPHPDEGMLRAVANHLARTAGVVGAEVVAAGPRYREVAVHALLHARTGSDLAAVAAHARDMIDRWLDPLIGDDDGSGWPFGAPLRADELTRLLLRDVLELVAVSQLSFRAAGRRLAPCADLALESDELPWRGSHVLDVTTEQEMS